MLPENFGSNLEFNRVPSRPDCAQLYYIHRRTDIYILCHLIFRISPMAKARARESGENMESRRRLASAKWRRAGSYNVGRLSSYMHERVRENPPLCGPRERETANDPQRTRRLFPVNSRLLETPFPGGSSRKFRASGRESEYSNEKRLFLAKFNPIASAKK